VAFLGSRGHKPHKPWPPLQPYLEALAPVALALLVALLTRGCRLPSWVRLPPAPSFISAAAVALQEEAAAAAGGSGGSSSSSEQWATPSEASSGSGGGSSSGSSGSGARAPFLPPSVCSVAARALFTHSSALSPGAYQEVLPAMPVLALLLAWHLSASYLLPAPTKPAAAAGSTVAAPAEPGSGGLYAQLPKLAGAAFVLWRVTRDVGAMILVLFVVSLVDF
jgi:hypothetical protein